MRIGFAMCGSFCTFASVFPVMETLAETNSLFPIFSYAASSTASRFGTPQEFLNRAASICGYNPWLSIADVEPIGPKHLLDALIIAPCTGNTLSKLAHGIADTPVTMAAKSHLRNGGPVIIAVSTNDGLAAGAENIGRLLVRKHFFFVPFRQDDPIGKPCSLVADFSLIPDTLNFALQGKQIQPVLR